MLSIVFPSRLACAVAMGGYARGKTVYDKVRQPHFAAALERRVEENLRLLRLVRGRVIYALADRAIGGGCSPREANAAARLFLEWTGDIGKHAVSSINDVQVRGDTFIDFVQGLVEPRPPWVSVPD